MAENTQPIIIKKIKKGGHGGHHGGSWKVAYADFVTAMMAFFLLLWLLSSTNEETLMGVADYFDNPSAINGAGGASTSMIKLGDNVDVSKGDGSKNRESNSFEYYSEAFEKMELEKLESLKDELEYEIERSPALSEFKDQLMIDITDEGLHIQIVDKNNRPMFDLGSALLKSYARKIIREIAPILNKVENKISISGHTDARQYMRSDGYSNWELSSDRANAARRELVKTGFPQKKVSRVVGLASKFLLFKENPLDPRNRRISILLMKKKVEDDIYRGQGLEPEQQSKTMNKEMSSAETKTRENERTLEDAIRSGTTRRTGEIVRFRGTGD